jgi:hypothetical protein
VLSAVEVENVLDVVAVESAAAVILYGDGPGVSGLWSCGKSTTGSAHADGACNDGGDQQLSCVAGLTIKPTTAMPATQAQAMNDRRHLSHLDIGQIPHRIDIAQIIGDSGRRRNAGRLHCGGKRRASMLPNLLPFRPKTRPQFMSTSF